jgi:gluconokinase
VLALAESVPAGSDGLVMLPYLLAERAPLWDPDLPGAVLGLRRRHTRAHLVRAAVEGVCLQMRVLVDCLDAVDPVRSVRATGGVFRSQLWREVMAAVLGRRLELVGDAEGSALGAAILGLVGVGKAATLAEAAALLVGGPPAPLPVVDPDPVLVRAYDGVRASVPELIGGLDAVARLLGGTPRV